MTSRKAAFDESTDIDGLTSDELGAYIRWATNRLAAHGRDLPRFAWGLPVSDSSVPCRVRARQLRAAVTKPDAPAPGRTSIEVGEATVVPTPRSATTPDPLPYTPPKRRRLFVGSKVPFKPSSRPGFPLLSGQRAKAGTLSGPG